MATIIICHLKNIKYIIIIYTNYNNNIFDDSNIKIIKVNINYNLRIKIIKKELFRQSNIYYK